MTSVSPAFTEAFHFVCALHGAQRRKGTTTPYLAHLLGVTALVLEHGGTETQAIAALLHDAIEDHPRGGRTREEIRERFGEAVLGIVEACTDADSHPKPPWRQRKERYLAHLPELPGEARLVVLADKVHNARAILADYRTVGDAVFDRFKASKAETLWYYRALADALLRIDGGPLAQELDRAVAQLETEVVGGEQGERRDDRMHLEHHGQGDEDPPIHRPSRGS